MGCGGAGPTISPHLNHQEGRKKACWVMGLTRHSEPPSPFCKMGITELAWAESKVQRQILSLLPDSPGRGAPLPAEAQVGKLRPREVQAPA